MSDKKKKELKVLSSSDSRGSNHNCLTKVMLNSNLFNELDEQSRSDIAYDAGRYIEEIRNKIELAHAKQYRHEKRQENIEAMKELFHRAGFDPIYAKVIENQYDSNPAYYTDPWLIVTTAKGPIKIGWRKRVIEINWSESDIKQSAKDLFPSEAVTKVDQSIHAWGKEKAVNYLYELKNADKV
jgi:hypothetical protein